MATGTFLDGLSEWNAKSAVVIKDLALGGDFETASLLSSLRTTANDESLTEEVRLNALTALINRGELLDIPVPPYYPVAFSFTPTQTYVGLHNDLSGLNTGDYWHLTYAQYLSVLNKASISDITFGNLTGDVDDSIPLSNALDLKQDAIPAGSTGQFFGWDGTMRSVSWANLSSKPTTLSGLGISSSDTLFDGRYLSQSSILTSYTLGSNAAVSNTDSLVGAIGKLQAQVNSVGSSTGTLNSVGLSIVPAIFSVANSPLTGTGGTINVTLQSQAAKTFLAAPNAGSGTPSFRQIVVADLPTSGVTAGNYGNTTNWPTFTVDSYGRITSITTQAATSGGTVTSVGLSAPVEFVVSNSPVIDDGVLGLSWDSATANYVFAGPATNVEEVPSFRALVPADIPALAISKITGLQGALDAKMSDSLNTSLIYMGNTSAKAVQSQVAGDLTALWSLVGSTNTATFTIVDGAVTYAKFANVPDSALNTARPILLGRFDADQGPMQQMTLTNDFTLSEDGIIGLASPNPPALTDIGDLLTSTGDNNLVRLPVGASGSLLMPYNNGIDPNPGLIWGNVGGDISYTVNTDATPYGEFLIGDNKVTLGQMALADAFSIIGNDTSSPATPVYLTKTQATTLINSFDPTLDLPGLVPNGSGNDATYYLDGTGNWSQPGGGGGGGGTVTSVSVVTANGFAGTVATATTTPAITLSTTVTGILKGNGTTISAATAGTDYLVGTVSLANGGTNASNTAVNGGVAYSTASAINITAAGTAGQIFMSAGAAAPVWTTATYPSTTVKDKILVSTANNVVGEIDAPATNNTFLKWNAGVFSWDTAGGTGTVTTTGSPASGNMAKFSGSTSITNAIAGTDYVAPGTVTTSGLTMSTSRLLGRTTASTGAIEEISLTTTGTSGAATLSGGILNIPQYSGGSGSGTVNSATLGAIAYYAATGTAVSGTTNLYVDNTNGRINIGAFTAPSARVQISAGTASVPQIIATPSTLSGSLSGTTNGSMWYDTTSGTNSSLYLYKDSGLTKFITKDRNLDFATGSNSGVIVSDTSGTLTKSADLTALGIFSGTADGSTLAAAGNADLLPTSVVGSKTLPASFFAVGKTIEVFVSGKITTIGSPGNLVLKLQFGSTPTDIATITLPLHANITNGYWDARFVVVCRTTGATGGISANGVARMETNANANMVYGDVVVPTTLPTINTAATQDIKVNGAITVSNSVTIQNCYANYLN